MNPRTVLADTGPLYAAADPDDAQHARAQLDLRKLADAKYEVAIAFPTLLEAYTLVLFRLGRSAGAHWLEDMSGAALLNPSAENYRQAVARVQSFPDRGITLFDATVAVLAARLRLKVWTYDHHFDLMRVPVWRP